MNGMNRTRSFPAFPGARPRRRRGFTFMEIMLVVVIIGILSAIVVPQIFQLGEQSRENATKSQIQNIKTALQMYYVAVGEFPSTDQGLRALRTCPSDVDPERWGDTAYVDRIPKDGWNNEFIYRSPGEHGPYDIVSKGHDAEEGTEDDIVSWDKEEEEGY